MEIPRKTQAHSVWNRPRLGEDNRTRARETYQGAAAQLKSELASASKESDPVDIYASVRELEILVNEAKDKYRDGRSKHTHAGARQWLESLSYHMVRFSRAFDTVPVHHQGYVNLAWGAIKFVLKAIIDRPVLIQKLCEALVAIADVLPRGNFNAELYPTNVMESALARLYSQMILFSLECVRWYNRSPLGRFWSTINGPFELHYKDLAQQIKLCSENIEALANSGRQAEARQSHELLRQQDCRLSALDAKLIEMHTGYEQTRADLQRLLQYASSHGTLLNSISIDTQAINQRTFRIEFHQVLKFFTPKVHPDKALLRVQSLTMRNPTWTMPSHNTPRIQRHLTDWVSSDRSSLLVVRVTLGQQKQARELAADVIKSLKTSAQTVLWSLSLYNTSERTITTSDVFKGIIFQLIHRLGPAVAEFAEDLNLSKIDSPHTDHEWVDLICKLLSKVPDVFIVLETEDLNQVYQHDAEWADRFLQLLQGIVERVGASGVKLKLLVVIYGGVVDVEEGTNGNYDLVETSLQVAVPVPPRLRHVAQRTALNTRGWRMQRPKI